MRVTSCYIVSGKESCRVVLTIVTDRCYLPFGTTGKYVIRRLNLVRAFQFLGASHSS
ncbi:protein of unknown function [Candidatus Promineifilum breve]|uniref:Uncharacterized protein n=1 Tax=Candidatus Promineifilum breve TaxID=1806508 RepID=A0A160T1U3_9CHLR|nr:protein of unknown function [Candidatus Promineifilum breve]